MIAPEFQEILDEYFQSTRELLETAEESLLEMEREEGVPSPERIQDLKRTFHTLKGNSAMMGFGVVADLAHLMEDLLGAASRGEVAIEEDLIALLLTGMGLVSEVVRSGDFEGVLTWVIGVRSKARFRISTLPNPSRVVVELDAP